MSLVQLNLTDQAQGTNASSNLTPALNITATIPINTFFSVGFGAQNLYNLDVIMFRALQNVDTIEVKDMTFRLDGSTKTDESEDLLRRRHNISEDGSSVTFTAQRLLETGDE